MIKYLFKTRLDRLVFVLTILTGLLIRLFLAPYTSGSDIPQFAGFADTFLKRGFCFYKFSSSDSSSIENWPYPWPYPYGPLLILLLSLVRIGFSQEVEKFWIGNKYYVYAPFEWIIVVKLIFIVSDTLCVILIYLIISRISGKRSVLAPILFYLNPVTIYVSSIYGMFDSLPLAIFLLALYVFLCRNNSFRNIFFASFLLGLSLSTKITVLYPVIALLIAFVLKNSMSYGKILTILLGFTTGVSILYVPFEIVCSNSLLTHFNVLVSTSRVGSLPPIIYSFNGFTNLAKYLHDMNSVDLKWIAIYWWIPSTILIVTLLIIIFTRSSLDYVELSYIFYLLFLTTYWCIHYQYFTILIGLASIYLFTHRFSSGEKIKAILTTTYVFLTILWFFMFPTSWWAVIHVKEPNQTIIRILDLFSFKIYSSLIYLIYSIVLTIIGYLNILVAVFFLFKYRR